MKLDKIAVASGNKGKIKEIKQIFTGAETVSMSELGFDGDIPETGTTFKENALIKAKFIAEKFNLPALADDSGFFDENSITAADPDMVVYEGASYRRTGSGLSLVEVNPSMVTTVFTPTSQATLIDRIHQDPRFGEEHSIRGV